MSKITSFYPFFTYLRLSAHAGWQYEVPSTIFILQCITCTCYVSWCFVATPHTSSIYDLKYLNDTFRSRTKKMTMWTSVCSCMTILWYIFIMITILAFSNSQQVINGSRTNLSWCSAIENLFPLENFVMPSSPAFAFSVDKVRTTSITSHRDNFLICEHVQLSNQTSVFL